MRNILFLGEEVEGEHTFPMRLWIVKGKHLTDFTLSEGSGRIVLFQLLTGPLRNKTENNTATDQKTGERKDRIVNNSN